MAFFHVDPAGWDEDRRLGILAMLPRLKAERLLDRLAERPDLRFKPDTIYELALQATGDEEASQKAAHDYTVKLLQEENHTS